MSGNSDLRAQTVVPTCVREVAQPFAVIHGKFHGELRRTIQAGGPDSPREASVDTTGFHGAGHAVDTIDAISQASSLPVKIYLDK